MSRVAFQLLELSLISALDLAPVIKNLSKHLKTYAVIWMDPSRKLRTRPDQKGNHNPHWNEKFVFRIEDELLDSDTASVMVEIYAVGWLRDNLVGSVGVLLRDLIPPSARKEKRVVALQVRRGHNGRPQGILSMGVALLDNTMKSMPLCTVITGSAVGYQDFCGGGEDQRRLVRTLSDQTDLSRLPVEGKRKRCGSICDGSVVGGGSVIDFEFGGGGGVGGRCGSVVNGGDASVISDLGPSPSVVAIAMAHGLYPLQQRAAPANHGGSVLEGWTVEAGSTVEEVQTRLEQWRLERHEGYKTVGKKRQKKRDHRRSRTVGGGGGGGGDGDGRFSCFGKVCGCEVNIVYGSGGNKRARKNWGRGSSARSVSSDSEL